MFCSRVVKIDLSDETTKPYKGINIHMLLKVKRALIGLTSAVAIPP